MAAFSVKVLNLKQIQAKIEKLPKSVEPALKAGLKTEVDDLVEAEKRAAPVDDTSDNPGALRDSIHAYENEKRAISYFVIADAKDANGKFIGSNVEQGHRAVDGTHVPAQPFFWPTYRARKKGMKRRISAAARKAIREYWGAK